MNNSCFINSGTFKFQSSSHEENCLADNSGDVSIVGCDDAASWAFDMTSNDNEEEEHTIVVSLDRDSSLCLGSIPGDAVSGYLVQCEDDAE